jgi:glycosyltransferase involved in cell wall biosynthesis
MRVDIVDASAFTPPYDHALAAALAQAGASVRLVTSRFAYGDVPAPEGYSVREHFYRHSGGAPGSRRRQLSKLAEHIPDMLRYRRARHDADIAHFQWFDVQWLDGALLPRAPVVLTAHDLLPREPRLGQAAAQRRLYRRMDAIIVHSDYGRRLLVDGLELSPDRIHVIHHGAFEHLTRRTDELPLPAELEHLETPVVMFFGLLRPYKGLDVLLDAWRGIADAELWIVGHPRMPIGSLRARAPANVRFLPRFVDDRELPALFRRADVVVLPYTRTERLDQSGVLATALAFGTPTVLSDIGGFSEIAATGAGRLVPPGDPVALHEALTWLLGDAALRAQMGQAALAAAGGPYSWAEAGRKTLALYQSLLDDVGHNPPP